MSTENELEIDIEVNGTLHQCITITNGMTPEKVKEGMKKGNILTSVGHSCNNGKVYNIEGGKFDEVGYVSSQESLDDTEISIFESEEE